MPESRIQCDLCHRPWSSRLSFHCTSCAQAQLYGPRIQQTLTHLEIEARGKQIEEAAEISSTGHGGQSAELRPEKAVFVVKRVEAQKAVAEDRIRSIHEHAQTFQHEIQSLRSELDAWKRRISDRRACLEAAKRKLTDHQQVKLPPIQTSIEQTTKRWEDLYRDTVQARTFLCREAALLYGLTQRRRKSRAEGRDVYYIGGLPVIDLRDLNNASPTHLTTSTAHLAHLLHLLSHYLAVRLPAEITLPHKNYPHPTIFSPTSSYRGREVPFPGSQNTSAAQSSQSSPTASKHVPSELHHQGPLPKPRPLHLTKKLGVLAKENPTAYGAFVDGITLLAWDVAWLCKSQGLDVSDPKDQKDPNGRHHHYWEEVCAMGKNLWNLLFAAGKDSRENDANHPDRTNKSNVHSNGPKLGQLSHGTRRSFLGSGDAAEYMRMWRLRDPVRVIERVRAMLVAERTGADWEVVMDEEFGRGVGDDDGGGVGGTGTGIGDIGGGEQTGGVVREVKKTVQGGGERGATGEGGAGGVDTDYGGGGGGGEAGGGEAGGGGGGAGRGAGAGGLGGKRRESTKSEPPAETKARALSGWMKIRGRSGA